jgi:pyrroline-5-carboxylate reductase
MPSVKSKNINGQWGFIGCGHLSQALIMGLIQHSILGPSQISATNRSQSKLKKFSHTFKIKALTSNIELVKSTQVIILSVKPQDMIEVMQAIAPHIHSRHIVISLAAGVGSEVLNQFLPQAGAILRVMTNLPASIQEGVFGVSLVKGRKSDLIWGVKFFSKLGEAIAVRDDAAINSLTAGIGSGTGFVFYFMKIFSDWFFQKGFSKKQSRMLAVEAFYGTSALARNQNHLELDQLLKSVVSKNGTTFAGLKAMSVKKIAPTLKFSLEAANKRASQIAKSLRQKAK